MLEYKKGTVLTCKYDKEKVNPWTVIQSMVIRANDGTEYGVIWGISNNQDLFGEGDYVSMLVEDDHILYIKNY